MRRGIKHEIKNRSKETTNDIWQDRKHISWVEKEDWKQLIIAYQWESSSWVRDPSYRSIIDFAWTLASGKVRQETGFWIANYVWSGNFPRQKSMTVGQRNVNPHLRWNIFIQPCGKSYQSELRQPIAAEKSKCITVNRRYPQLVKWTLGWFTALSVIRHHCWFKRDSWSFILVWLRAPFSLMWVAINFLEVESKTFLWSWEHNFPFGEMNYASSSDKIQTPTNVRICWSSGVQFREDHSTSVCSLSLFPNQQMNICDFSWKYVNVTCNNAPKILWNGNLTHLNIYFFHKKEGASLELKCHK